MPMRSPRLICSALAILCPAWAGAQEVRDVIAEPVLESAPCDYGESNPRLPSRGESRAQLYDLFLGQRLREPERRLILAALKSHYPGEATDAFGAIAEARPYDGDESVRTFETVARRLGRSPDPDVRVEGRPRALDAGPGLAKPARRGRRARRVSGCLRDVPPKRLRAAPVAAARRYLRDYRGRGSAFDEFVAEAEYLALSREVGDLTPGEHLADGRLLAATKGSR